MKPMLAAKCTDVNALTYPVMASPKLDGIRAMVVDGVVMSRKMIPIPNRHVQLTFGKKKYDGLDGELVTGAANGDFIEASAGIMKIEGKPDVSFHVFDDYRQPTAPFHMRLEAARQRVERMAARNLKIVGHERITSAKQLIEYEENALVAGYEGVMVRSIYGEYKFGRSTFNEGWLLKLKRFEDGEAKVIGFEELQHNHNPKKKDALGNSKRASFKAGKVQGGTLGALIVKDMKTKVEFNIGSGFTADQRKQLWAMRYDLIGLITKYRYFPTGSKERPRFPTFLGFRDVRDMS